MKTNLDANVLLDASRQISATSSNMKDRAALKKSCQDFEALFVQSVFKAMRKTVPEGGIFTDSTATETFREMLDQEIATSVARKQSVGLADQIYRQMEKKLAPGNET